MRRKISLYIDGKRVDVDDQSFILFNYTQDEQSNPTIVKNSYSQTITLPGSPNNNEVFDKYFRLDRITSSTGFKSLEKTSFAIYDEMGDVLESGYAKLDSIKKEKNGKVEYSVSLYGGLGGFFYNLMYNEDGTKKTLADLQYKIGTSIITPSTYSMSIDKDEVADAWRSLYDSDATPLYELINFAPAYNGFPSCKFGANRAVYHPGNTDETTYPNLYTQALNSESVVYTAKPGCDNNILLELARNHTEWELQDLRSYLQRPVISVKKILESLTLSVNSGEYTFALDSGFFNSSNPWYNSAWITLAMFDRDSLSPSSFKLSSLLQGTQTPADYLIGIAKMFGLCFVTDSATKTITLMGRNAFYTGDVVDLSKRIDQEDSITPNTMDSKFYVFEPSKTLGEYTEDYETKFKKVYGSQWVNTGYSFNAEQTDVVSSLPFQGAADVLEASTDFQIYGADMDDSSIVFKNYFFKCGIKEDVSWKLYHQSGTDLEEESFTPAAQPVSSYNTFNYSQNSTLNDAFAKVQLHQEDNKAQDGKDVLLFYRGAQSYPDFYEEAEVIASVKFHLSDDSTDMLTLNDSVPCYDVSLTGDNILDISTIPVFSRWKVGTSGLTNTFDFGDPLEVANGETLVTGKGIYANFWKKYIADKFDMDTKIVTIKVDLTGIKVDSSLLRKFYFFGNCLWVLNKITNHSLTTYDLTECEFIRVKEKENYTNGQITF